MTSMRLSIADRRSVLLFSCSVLFLTIGRTAKACTPESYFLFRTEAQQRLDSLSAQPTDANAMERLILMHNLAFHKDKKMRERAEKLMKRGLPKDERTPLIQAYEGSLKMIKVSHRTAGSKVFRTVNPLTKSPHAEALQGYRLISQAVQRDSLDIVLRLLRATAAAESAEHLHELFDSARIDLMWLDAHVDMLDSASVFLTDLNWAKYYYKLARSDGGDKVLRQASDRIAQAITYACTPVYREWAGEWKSRIEELLGDIEK